MLNVLVVIGVSIVLTYLAYRRLRYGVRFNKSLGDAGFSALVSGILLVGLVLAKQTRPPTVWTFAAVTLIILILAAGFYWSIDDFRYYNKRRDAGLPDVDPKPKVRRLTPRDGILFWLGPIAALVCVGMMFRDFASSGLASGHMEFWGGLMVLSIRLDSYIADARGFIETRVLKRRPIAIASDNPPTIS